MDRSFFLFLSTYSPPSIGRFWLFRRGNSFPLRILPFKNRRIRHMSSRENRWSFFFFFFFFFAIFFFSWYRFTSTTSHPLLLIETDLMECPPPSSQRLGCHSSRKVNCVFSFFLLLNSSSLSGPFSPQDQNTCLFLPFQNGPFSEVRS